MIRSFPAVCASAILAALAAGTSLRAGEADPPETLTAAVERLQELEGELADLRSTVASTGEALAGSIAEATAAREEARQLRLTMEALGIAALKPELKVIQQRLVSALNDYRLADRDRKALAERLLALSESALTLVSDPSSEAARENLRREIAEANSGLAAAGASEPPPPVSLDSARVISVRRDLGLAVIDAGRESGLRMGTPMKFTRGVDSVAAGIVVDLRNRIAGILLTSNTSGDPVRPGDAARADTTEPSKK